jgi:hypothetical protein
MGRGAWGVGRGAWGVGIETRSFVIPAHAGIHEG